MAALLNFEQAIRLSVFLGVLALMMLFEIISPHRRFEVPRLIRWSNNIGMVIVDTIVLRLTLPVLAVGTALWAQSNDFGLIHMLEIPIWIAVPTSVLFLDFAIYWQHVLSHRIPWFWRLHRVHHSDQGFDATTALRFHPAEILISMLFKMALVVVLGIPAEAVLLFEVLLNGTAIFNHSNIRLPKRIDRVVRWLLVTPDMHRVHHSSLQKETDSNFGFNLPIWDRLFGTYIDQPSQGHDKMTIGLTEFRGHNPERLDKLLVQPVLPTPKRDAK